MHILDGYWQSSWNNLLELIKHLLYNFFRRAFLDGLYRVSDMLLPQSTPPLLLHPDPEAGGRLQHPPPPPPPSAKPFTPTPVLETAGFGRRWTGGGGWLLTGLFPSRQLTRKRFFDLFVKRKRRRVVYFRTWEEFADDSLVVTLRYFPRLIICAENNVFWRVSVVDWREINWMKSPVKYLFPWNTSQLLQDWTWIVISISIVQLVLLSVLLFHFL